MLADLHCHSLRSDGQLSPSDLVDRAAEQGVTMLALTDHDTLDGIEEARDQARKYDMQIVSGIEFSSVWNGMGIHIVGLGFDEQHPVMQAAVARQEACRYERAKTIAMKLEKQGVEGIWEKAVEIANGAQIGRPHFAEALIQLGKVNNMAQAFKKYLGAGKAGDVKTLWPEMSEVVSWIRESGGVAVVAHPDKYKLTVTKLKLLLNAFVAAGGNGLEVTTGGMESSFSQRMAQLCDEYDLLGSQGSDFHGPRPWSELGKFVPMPKSVTPVWSHWQAV
ncbi:MAG: PHP domain-containing protein [Gammaproteobacteria bacterium]|nr:PHP domain-containing protein [Gammaproteobacteria bacterium]